VNTHSCLLAFLQGSVPTLRQPADHDLRTMRDLERQPPSPAELLAGAYTGEMTDSDSLDGHGDVYSASRVSVTLRSILAVFRSGGVEAVPMLISEDGEGEPEAVLLPYDLFRALTQALEDHEDRAVAALAAERMALADQSEGSGLDNEELARLVAAGRRTGPTS
jgi:hypothetical protein